MSLEITPTQVDNPGRTVARTVLQNIIGFLLGFALIGPFALGWLVDVLDKAGFSEWSAMITVYVPLAVALAGGAAKIMSLPSVERWLQESAIFRKFAAVKVEIDNGPGDLGFDASVSGYSAVDRTHDDRLTVDGDFYGDPIPELSEEDTPDYSAVVIEDDAELPDPVNSEDVEPKHRAPNEE